MLNKNFNYHINESDVNKNDLIDTDFIYNNFFKENKNWISNEDDTLNYNEIEINSIRFFLILPL
jgi:hypothetical protein